MITQQPCKCGKPARWFRKNYSHRYACEECAIAEGYAFKCRVCGIVYSVDDMCRIQDVCDWCETKEQ